MSCVVPVHLSFTPPNSPASIYTATDGALCHILVLMAAYCSLTRPISSHLRTFSALTGA